MQDHQKAGGMSSVADFIRTPIAQGVIWCGVLLIGMTIAWYFLNILRVRAKSNDVSGDYLSYFREMHGRGVLSDHEYRRIRSNLDHTGREQRRTAGSSDRAE